MTMPNAGKSWHIAGISRPLPGSRASSEEQRKTGWSCILSVRADRVMFLMEQQKGLESEAVPAWLGCAAWSIVDTCRGFLSGEGEGEPPQLAFEGTLMPPVSTRPCMHELKCHSLENGS